LLFSRRLFFKFHFYLHRMALAGMGIGNGPGFRESGEKLVLKRISKKYSINTIFDVGAHRGNYAKMLCEIFPESSIYCFEPNPQTFAELNSKINSQFVSKYNFGFSEKAGEELLYDFNDRNGTAFASLHKKIFTDIYKRDIKTFSVQLEVLDAFLEKNKIETIDFLKIDTEGNDFNVLLGAKNALKNKAIKIIQFEFNETYIYSGAFIKDFKNLFKDYNLYRILTHGIIPLEFKKPVDYEIFLFQNILAIQKENDKLK